MAEPRRDANNGASVYLLGRLVSKADFRHAAQHIHRLIRGVVEMPLRHAARFNRTMDASEIAEITQQIIDEVVVILKECASAKPRKRVTYGKIQAKLGVTIRRDQWDDALISSIVGRTGLIFLIRPWLGQLLQRPDSDQLQSLSSRQLQDYSCTSCSPVSKLSI